MASSEEPERATTYAMLFEKTPDLKLEEGYLFVDLLQKGERASGVMLVRSVTTGKLFARKYISPEIRYASQDADVTRNVGIYYDEVEITRELTDTGFSVRFDSTFNSDVAGYCTMVTEFCNGGDALRWFSRYATPENREFMAWLVILECTRTLAHLHSEQATTKGAIYHGDVHAGNIFLQFETSNPIPRILMGDYGCSDYKRVTPGELDLEYLQFHELKQSQEFIFLGDIQYALLEKPVSQDVLSYYPEIPKSLQDFLSFYPERLKDIGSAQKFLENVEAEATSRMAFLRSLPGFQIPRPYVRDTPWTFMKPEIIEERLQDLKDIPQGAPGYPRWRWVKLDWTDGTFEISEILPEEATSVWDELNR
jgi:serine/threonine protein kinase